MIETIDLYVNSFFHNRNTIKEIKLFFFKTGYANGGTKLEIQNGKIQIIYMEHAPIDVRYAPFDYKTPYFFAGKLQEPLPDTVFKLTSDYLHSFAGEYVFDSYSRIDREKSFHKFEEAKSFVLAINYNQEKKCLTTCVNLDDIFDIVFSGYNRRKCENIDFVETTNDEPFYWMYGEGAGYTEIRLYFYKGGIAYTYERQKAYCDSEDIDFTKFVLFFRKR